MKSRWPSSRPSRARSPVSAERRSDATSRPGSSDCGVPGPIGLNTRSTVAARPCRRAASTSAVPASLLIPYAETGCGG